MFCCIRLPDHTKSNLLCTMCKRLLLPWSKVSSDIFFSLSPNFLLIFFKMFKLFSRSVGQSVGGWSVNWSGNHLVVWERQSNIYSFTESSICQSLLMPYVWKFLVIRQCHVLLACTLWEVDLKTVQHAQVEVHALILLVHLWLVLEVNIPFYLLLKLQT